MSCYCELGMCLPTLPDGKGVSWVYPPMDKSRPPSLGLMARSCTQGHETRHFAEPGGHYSCWKALCDKKSAIEEKSSNDIEWKLSWQSHRCWTKFQGSQVYCLSCLAAPAIPQSVSFHNPGGWVFLSSLFFRQKVIPLQVSYLVGRPIRTEVWPKFDWLQSLGF